MSFLLTVALVQLIALLSPGPDFLFVSQGAARHSRKVALAGVLGITLGVAFWSALALAGLHLLFQQLAWLQRAVSFAGGLYLCWIGIQMLRSALRHPAAAVETSGQAVLPRTPGRAWRQGLLTNLANPKVVIYFGSIFSAFVGEHAPLALRWELWLLVVAETLAWFTAVALVFGLPAMRAGYARIGRALDGVAGAVFGLFGLELLWRARLAAG
ncbi:LysE family transporter [Frateuria aurantia]